MSSTPDTSRERLAYIFCFSETDLMANRLGRLSEHQKSRRNAEKFVGQSLLILLGLGLIVAGFIPPEAAGSFETLRVLFTTGHPPAGLPSQAIFEWLGVKLPGLGLLGVGALSLTLLRDKTTLRRVAGPIHLEEVRSRRSLFNEIVAYRLQVGNVFFSLSLEQGRALVPNRPYAVYYFKQAWVTWIISLEPLPADAELGPEFAMPLVVDMEVHHESRF